MSDTERRADTSRDRKKRVAWVPLGQLTTASSRMRAYQVADVLQRHYGVESYFPGMPMSAAPDVLVAQIYSPEIVALAGQLKQFGCRTLLDICDNVWDVHSPNYHPQWDLDLALRTFNGVIATTPTLAERLRARYPAVSCRLMPDSIDLREIGVGAKRHESVAGVLRIAWFGTEINMKHMLMILPALRRLHAEVPLQVRIISKAMLYELPGLSVEFVKWGLDTYQQDLQACDAVVLPMTIDGSTEVKSPNRLQLCMALGLPTVVSPLPSYLDLLGRHPEIALVADSEDGWYSHLKTLLDPARRNEIAQRGREIIEAEYTIEHYAERWHQTLFTD